MAVTTDYSVLIRDAVYDKIVGQKHTFEIGTVEVEKTYFPQENLEDLSDHPHIKVVGFFLGDDLTRELRKARAYPIDIPVTISIQQHVDKKDTDYIDRLHRLIRQLLQLLEDDELVSGYDFNWMRTEPLKDENGLIYSYEQLATQGVFQAIFTAHYTFIKES